MIRPSSAISNWLTWSALPHHQGDEVKCNDEIVGRLLRPSIWSSDHVASTADGSWTFRRRGFLGSAAEIVDSATQQHIAAFKSAWDGRGTLSFLDEQVFHLDCKGWWDPVWRVTNEGGELILSVHTCDKSVDLAVPSVPTDRLWLLIMFTLYRVQQAEEDIASSAMVSVMAIV